MAEVFAIKEKETIERNEMRRQLNDLRVQSDELSESINNTYTHFNENWKHIVQKE